MISFVNIGATCEVCGNTAIWESSTPEKPPQHFLCRKDSLAWYEFTATYPSWQGYIQPGTRVNRTRWEETFAQFVAEAKGSGGSAHEQETLLLE